MKRLYLVRHATALPEQFPLRDFDRNLAEEGASEVKKLADFFISKGSFPEVVVCSAANRTVQTGRLLLDGWGRTGENLKVAPELYNAPYASLIQFIQSFSPSVDSLMVVAHNPGISQLATVLSGSQAYQFSTAAALCLEFDSEHWSGISVGAGKEIWYFFS